MTDSNYQKSLEKLAGLQSFESEINKAPHYNQHPSGVECIDVIEHFSANLAFATKYIWRQGLKPDNDAIKDLKKARYYIEREIERLENASN